MSGRPPIFKTAAEFTAVADAYLDKCVEDQEVATVNGLCLALGMCRDTLWEYDKKPEFSDAVKMARTKLEATWEKRLSGPNATGTIFWLKNQGWKDSVETVHGGAVEVKSINVGFRDG